jgi:IstB-like ATP binding protein
MIFTTNKPRSEWGKVLHDEAIAAAILDRVLERGRFLHLDGPPGRTRPLELQEVKVQEVLPGGPDRARISGIDLPEFSEPTGGGPLRSFVRPAVSGLFRAGLLEWITTMTYQVVSGAGGPRCWSS